MVITIYNTTLTKVYKWLEQELDLRIGRDWFWTWDHSADRPAVEFVDPKTELLVKLKAKNV